MDPLTISAASGMRSRMESLDMLANNLANTETGGYKADREFYNLYVSAEAAADGGSPATLPVVERNWTDFSQGQLRLTGSPLDLAISGKGFFTVAAPNGSLYTRNGNFRVSPAGLLTTAEGYPVLTAGGGKLAVQPSGAILISADGTVNQNGQDLGQLAIADFADPGSLVKQGANYYQGGSEPSQAASGATVMQGSLESSNVAASESAVRLVSVMRQFEMLQKAASVGAQMNRESVQEVARVSS